MRIAIVHDWFMNFRGAERQLVSIAEIFPDADIFFLIANHKLVKEHFYYKLSKIRKSFLDSLPFRRKLYPYFFPLLPLISEGLDLREYDLVISSSSHGAKGIITGENSFHVCYMYTPTRHLWDLSNEYFPERSLIRFLAGPLMFYLRAWDFQAGQRPDKIVSISKFVSERINKYYRRGSKVIYPGVDLTDVVLVQRKEDYYVHVTSFESNKNTELVVETFRKNGRVLKLIGPSTRRSRKMIRKLPKNIEFLGWLDDGSKNRLIGTAKSVIISGVEDFGMVAVEAQHLGTPVIAYAEGGSLETVPKNFLFEKKTVESLQAKIDEVDRKEIDLKALRGGVSKFGEDRFKSEFRNFVLESYANWN